MAVDITTRPQIQRAGSVIELVFSILCFGYGATLSKPWVFVTRGTLILCDVARILGWKLEMTAEDLRVRRYFLWRSIPWTQIRAAEVGDTWGRGQKAVRLTLASQPVMSLGAFGSSLLPLCATACVPK
jgi:hypothetical protein